MRNRVFATLDLLTGAIVIAIAFSARFEGFGWWSDWSRVALVYAALTLPIRLSLFFFAGLYSRLWRYASIADLEAVMVGCVLGAVASFAIGLGVMPALHLAPARVPIGVVLTDSILSAGAVTTSRLLLRVLARRRRRARFKMGPPVTRGLSARAEDRLVLIAGAGQAGGMIAKELLENQHLGMTPVGFVDDDERKHGHHLHGLPVLGPIDQLEEIVRKLSIVEVVTAMPMARGKVIREIMRQSTAAGVPVRTVPGLYELISGAKSVSALRPIRIEDLLRRDPITTDSAAVASLVTGETVLITGAGGSIGSELCRQLCQLSPKLLVVVGRGENSIFELVQELKMAFPHIDVRPAIIDVRDAIRMRAIFEETRPFSVFHAAAHKHVPLMEANVDEAVLNNVLGTRNVVELSDEFDVAHMVLISTDKAVRPTSIMGATKRIAEAVLCSMAERSKKSYVAVRFGNVLGSRGSVVPTFLRQIAAGGPVTVTDPEMRRYFMTIPEAVQLVLQAAALGRGGEVFVLDMGDPVRITDLAEDLIRLSGLEVGQDIEIVYTGMRPGEKLYEELFFGADDAVPTSHPKILKARDTAVSDDLEGQIDELIVAARARAPETELRDLIRQLVPEYAPTAPGLIDRLAGDAGDEELVGPRERKAARRA